MYYAVKRGRRDQHPDFDSHLIIFVFALFSLIHPHLAYNHLLGFDHVFMFYRPEMKNVSRIDVLRALPFVTLSEWTGGTLENYYDQRATERLCLSDQKFARSYDWAMIADIDEYLWLPEVYDGVKAFLQQEAQNMTYLSFGKYMYTLDHRTDTAANNYKLDAMAKDSPFVFSQYPFYMNYFCYGIRIGEAICPTWRGRAKVIVKPANHQWIDVHGIYPHPINITGAVHYHPELGHFKEWPHIFDDHNITKRQPQCFTVEEEEDVHIHNMKRAFNTYKNGTYLVKYDDRLQQWFHRVINRARVPVISVS